MTEPLNPALYLVGTPIGNLEDITFRALRILQSAHLIAAEDTRHTGKLLQHYQITTPQVSYHQHNHHQRLPELLEHLHSGKSLALVSDAGMPSISDPGYELVKVCIEAEIAIIPIPGVTALITALAASGLPTNSFSFEGFLPTKTKARNAHLESLKNETRTLIFYESPHRLRQTLADFATVFGGERQIVLGRELTKIHEEFWRGTMEAAITLYREKRQPKGEYTLVIAGEETSSKIVLSEAEIKVELQQLLAQGMTRSQASRHLSQLTSLPRRQIYEISLD